jgi:hypothetical protein
MVRDLSLKGVARRYLELYGDFSVQDDVIEGPGSLRSRLEAVADEEVSFRVSECIYGWRARFEQVWTHVTVRVELRPKDGVEESTVASLRPSWAASIESAWSDQWATSRRGELPCPFTFEVQWVERGGHHTVRVREGPRRTTSHDWDTDDSGLVVAHEYGHLIGHVDEYADPDCPDRSPVDTGTIMDDIGGTVPSRLLDPFAVRLGTGLRTP